jgi:hypothetical protein
LVVKDVFRTEAKPQNRFGMQLGHYKEERLAWRMSLILMLNRRPGFARLTKRDIPKRGWYPRRFLRDGGFA